MAVDVPDEVRRALVVGWSKVRCPLAEFRRQASAHGLAEAPARAGEPAMQVLMPMTQGRARRRSLSAVHGTGAQPLHTDGAHQPAPPDLVVLAAAAASPTPTLLWRPPDDRWWHEHTTTGVFLVDGGRRRFLATARDVSGLRYDPVCMTPLDPPARRLADALAAAAHLASPHVWNDPEELLLIANRTVLHARAAVAPDDADRSLRRVAYYGSMRP